MALRKPVEDHRETSDARVKLCGDCSEIMQLWDAARETSSYFCPSEFPAPFSITQIQSSRRYFHFYNMLSPAYRQLI
ncbi:hypothetical protein PoB_007700100 [Plakobranchus ocellatus]|uniref:Uncharacterized protein n=1 Tax=Plakobranchus ocellatus TaxID=259542 RepID=A0AAV4E2A8_9GAST|nr:hypothetical protein PoB_007700100 [Plakobranchus ocellatus]